jgi:hypothetical protein
MHGFCAVRAVKSNFYRSFSFFTSFVNYLTSLDSRKTGPAYPRILYNGLMKGISEIARFVLRAGTALLISWGALLCSPAQESASPQLVYYQKARPLVDLSPEELRRDYLELGTVSFSEDQQDLSLVLSRTGESLDAFFRYFPNTISREKVRQERLGENGKIDAKLDQETYYLVVARTGRETSGFDESRTDAKGRPVAQKRLQGKSFLTSGFAGAGIFFLPVNQKEFRFHLLGRDPEMSGAYVVAFSAKRECGLQGKFEMGEDQALLLSQGLAWIHPDSFRLLTMTTSLQAILAPKPVVLALRTNILFDEVTFSSPTRAFSLPVKVEVNINWRGALYRNVHRYSDYRLFSVEVYESRSPVEKP